MARSLSAEDAMLAAVSIADHDRLELTEAINSKSVDRIAKMLGIRACALAVLADCGKAVMYLHEAKGLRCKYNLTDTIDRSECGLCGGDISIVNENSNIFKVSDAWFGMQYCKHCGTLSNVISRSVKVKQTENDHRAAQIWGSQWYQGSSNGG